MPLIGSRNRVGSVGRMREVLQPQRIVSEYMLAAVDHADVRPVIADADQLDAVAMVRLLLREALADQCDSFVLRVGSQRVVDRWR